RGAQPEEPPPSRSVPAAGRRDGRAFPGDCDRQPGGRRCGFLVGYLYSTAGSGYLTLIEAAITAHVRPTTMILGADNRKAYSDMDVLLLQAYQTIQNEKCPQHGGP